MTEFYNGKVVPQLNGIGMEMTCHNSLCHGVACIECINLPMGDSVAIKLEYLQEKYLDEYVPTSTKSILDV